MGNPVKSIDELRTRAKKASAKPKAKSKKVAPKKVAKANGNKMFAKKAN